MRDRLTDLFALAALRRDRRGVTALEYGIIISALAFTLVAIFAALGTPLSSVFSNVGNKI